MTNRSGVSLVEVAFAVVIILLASMGALSFYVHGYGGGIAKQGNRRAALERARQRLEQLLQTNPTLIKPPVDAGLGPGGQLKFWLTCVGSPCAWTQHASATAEPGGVVVDELSGLRMETSVQWKDDPSAGTVTTPDVLELGVKVWFTTDTPDDKFHRVYVKTLRTPL